MKIAYALKAPSRDYFMCLLCYSNTNSDMLETAIIDYIMS